MLQLHQRYSGHTGSVYALCKGADEYSVLSSGGDGFVVEWKPGQSEEGKLLARLGVQIFSIGCDPATGYVVAGDMHGRVHWFRPSVDTSPVVFDVHRCGVFDVKLIGDRLLTAGGDGRLCRWPREGASDRGLEFAELTTKSLRCMALHPDGKWLAVASSDHRIYLLDADSFETVSLVDEAHENSVFSLVWSADGRYLYSGGRDAHLKMWEFDGGLRLVHDVPAHLYTLNALEIIAGGRLLASASRDKTIRIWDAQNLELLKSLEPVRDGGHRHSVNRLVWLEETGVLVSSSDDRQIIAWQTTGY